MARLQRKMRNYTVIFCMQEPMHCGLLKILLVSTEVDLRDHSYSSIIINIPCNIAGSMSLTPIYTVGNI